MLSHYSQGHPGLAFLVFLSFPRVFCVPFPCYATSKPPVLCFCSPAIICMFQTQLWAYNIIFTRKKPNLQTLFPFKLNPQVQQTVRSFGTPCKNALFAIAWLSVTSAVQMGEGERRVATVPSSASLHSLGSHDLDSTG